MNTIENVDDLNNHTGGEKDTNQSSLHYDHQQITTDQEKPINLTHAANPTTSVDQAARAEPPPPIQSSLDNTTPNKVSKFRHRKYTLDKSVYSSNPCIGCLERIPLGIKLLLVVIISILSLTALGAYFIATSIKQLQTANNINTLSTFIISLGSITQHLQVELAYTVLMTNESDTTNIRNQLDDAIFATDQAIAAYTKHNFTAENLIFKQGLANLTREFKDASETLRRFNTARNPERKKMVSKQLSFQNNYALCSRSLNNSLMSIIYNDTWWENNHHEWNNTFYYFVFFNKCILRLLGVVSGQISDPIYNSYQDSYLLYKYELYYLYSQIWVGGCKYVLGNFTRSQRCIYDLFSNNVSVMSHSWITFNT